jgi:hypothetical protein
VPAKFAALSSSSPARRMPLTAPWGPSTDQWAPCAGVGVAAKGESTLLQPGDTILLLLQLGKFHYGYRFMSSSASAHNSPNLRLTAPPSPVAHTAESVGTEAAAGTQAPTPATQAPTPATQAPTPATPPAAASPGAEPFTARSNARRAEEQAAVTEEVAMADEVADEIEEIEEAVAEVTEEVAEVTEEVAVVEEAPKPVVRSATSGSGVQRWDSGVTAVQATKMLARAPKGVTVADVHGGAAHGVKFGASPSQRLDQHIQPDLPDESHKLGVGIIGAITWCHLGRPHVTDGRQLTSRHEQDTPPSSCRLLLHHPLPVSPARF